MSGRKNSPGPGLPIDDEEKASKTGDTTPRETSSPSEAEQPPNALRNDDEKYHNVEEEGRELEQVPTQASSQLPFSKARTIALVFILTGAAFLNTLSVQICVIVLPTIGAELGIPPARQQWIVSAYSLTFGCFLLLWGRLADVYGKRPIFIYGSAWVAVTTLICPFIPSEVGFDVFRGLQGLGAAANVPTAIGILGVTFQPGKAKTYAFALYSAGAPMGSVFGNIVGGVVGQYATWKWAFWILAIMAACLTAAGWYLIPQTPKNAAEMKVKNAVDYFGATLVTVGLIILLFALTEGNVVGWSTPYIPVLIVVSIILVTAFVFWQLHLEKTGTRRPLMKVTIFKNLRVSAAMLVMAFFFGGFNNFLIFATYYFQDYQGHNAILTAVRFLPTGVVGAMTVFVTSQMLARIKVNYIMMFGTLCTSTASLLFAVPIPPSTTYWAYAFPAMCLSVFGADTVFPSLLLFTAHSLTKEDQAIGGAIINAVGQIGRAIGLAIATAIQVAVQESRAKSANAVNGGQDRNNPSFLSGLRSAEWFNFALGLVAFAIATVAFRGAGKVGAAKK